jgi:TRAP-type C4-dicarboxylate transport system permease small subunit
MLVGAQIAGWVYNHRFLKDAPALTLQQWQSFWWLPAIFAAVVLLLFIAVFHEKRKAPAAAGEVAAKLV